MNNAGILSRISTLIEEEHHLRERRNRGELNETQEHEQLTAAEVELDQCWDLLRQRRALRETGGDPREAHLRPPDEVEGYLG